MRIGRRAAASATAMAVTALVLGLTACEPPTEATFTVVTDVDTPDADLGDGICADARDDCSLRAAIEEANAVGRATILVPDGLAADTLPAITGAVRMRPEAPAGRADFGPTTLVVAAGGHLDLARVMPDSGAAWYGSGRIDLEVAGSLQVRDSYLTSLEVPSGGSALLLQSTVRGHPDASQISTLANDGTVILWYSRALTQITTSTSATTVAIASELQSTCTGRALTSGGYNAGTTTACGLRAATDLPTGTDLGQDILEGQWDYGLWGYSPMLDAVPEGVAGCGASSTTAPTPPIVALDSDRDGTPGCEIGPRQVGPIREGSIG